MKIACPNYNSAVHWPLCGAVLPYRKGLISCPRCGMPLDYHRAYAYFDNGSPMYGHFLDDVLQEIVTREEANLHPFDPLDTECYLPVVVEEYLKFIEANPIKYLDL